jgi:hypothetical protein
MDKHAIITLTDVRAQDSDAHEVNGELRALCPFSACADKRNPRRHQSFTANLTTGTFICHRCRATGVLAEFRGEHAPRRNGAKPAQPDREASAKLHEYLQRARPLGGTPGAEYLRKRGFNPEQASACGTCFTLDFYGRPAICWDVRDLCDKVVALHGRHTDGRSEPKARTIGKLTAGVVWMPSFDACRSADEIAVVEAPLDAMALHFATDKPVTALCGTSPRPWLVEALRGRRALLAFDSDDAGEKAARDWAAALSDAGAEPLRLRPPEGAKDWAEALEKLGAEAMRASLPAPQAMQEPTAWPELEPLDTLPDPPPFPTEALPGPVCDFVKATAAHTQTPPDLPALLALGALATACARTARIEGASGWTEPLNLFICLALPSGSRKSAVVAACARPIEQHEAEALDRMRPMIATCAAERQTLEQRLQVLTRRAATCSEAERRAAEADRNKAARALAEHQDIHALRLLTDDATPEALGRLMAEQRGRIACLSAEGSIAFEQAAGRYSEQGAKFEVYLKGHAGDPLRVDRVGRAAEHVKEPALTLCLTVQPDVLRGAMARPDFRERGLLDRFLWSVPKPTLGYREIDVQPVPARVQDAYAACLHRLLAREPADEPPTLRLGPDAARVFREFRERAEYDLREGERFEYVRAWGAKLPGLVLRIAGLLHLAEHADGEPVSAATIEAAIAIGEYAAAHALAAFGKLVADPLLAKAESLLRWIKRNGFTEITARAAYRANRSAFTKPDEVEQALALLCDWAYVRELPRTDGPGRPSRRFAVTPRTLGQNCHNGQKPPDLPDFGISVHSVQGKTPATGRCRMCGKPSGLYDFCDACDPFGDDQ